MSRYDRLTKRQIEMLACAGNGMNRETTATTCFVSPHTVKSTMSDARERLDAKNNCHALTLAISYGLIIVRDGVAQAA